MEHNPVATSEHKENHIQNEATGLGDAVVMNLHSQLMSNTNTLGLLLTRELIMESRG